MMAAMTAMTIGFDVTSTIAGATGVARYVREVATALEALPTPPVIRRFAVGRAVVDGGGDAHRFRVPLRLVARSWGVGGPPSVERMVGPVDTVHAAGPVLPTTRRPTVAVVHDVAALDHPEMHPRRSVAQLRRYLAGLDRVAAVVTGTQATADRVSAMAPGATIHITPYGRTPLPAPDVPPLAGRPYVLAVGAPIPRKGYDDLLRAVARLDQPELQVALVGPEGSEDAALAELAGVLGLAERVHRVQAVSDAQLAGWYAAATIVAVPSIEEGFSLPVIEAQAQGVLVVASDIPVHREVAGSAAVLVAALDVPGLAEALEAGLGGDPALAAVASAGPANAARFTWEGCAAATAAVHQAVLGSG